MRHRTTILTLALLLGATSFSTASIAGEPFRCYASDHADVEEVEERPGEETGWCEAKPRSTYASAGGGAGVGIKKWKSNAPANTASLFRCTPDGEPASDTTPQEGLGWCKAD